MHWAVSAIHSSNSFSHFTKLKILPLNHGANGEEATPDEIVLILIWEHLFPGFSHHDAYVLEPLGSSYWHCLRLEMLLWTSMMAFVRARRGK